MTGDFFQEILETFTSILDIFDFLILCLNMLENRLLFSIQLNALNFSDVVRDFTQNMSSDICVNSSIIRK